MGPERFKRTACHAGLAWVQRRARLSYWPAGTVAFHTGADIATRWSATPGATDNERLEKDFGLDWSWWPKRPGCGARSATAIERAGFRIDGVNGPDEYSVVKCSVTIRARSSVGALRRSALGDRTGAERLVRVFTDRRRFERCWRP